MVAHVVGHGALDAAARRGDHAIVALGEVAEAPAGIDRGDGNDVRADGRITQPGRLVRGKAVARRHGDEDSVGLELGELVFERCPGGNGLGVRWRSQREVDRGDGIGEAVAVRMHPLERLLDPTDLSVALIVEHPQGHDVGAGGHAGGAGVVAGDDAGHVGAVRAHRAVVVGIVVVLGEVVSAYHAMPRPISVAQRQVIVGNARVDHRHRLTAAGETVLGLDLIQADHLAGIGRTGRKTQPRFHGLQPQDAAFAQTLTWGEHQRHLRV